MVGHDGRGDHEHRGDYARTVMAKMKTTMAMRSPYCCKGGPRVRAD